MQAELVPGELARRRRLDQHEVSWRVRIRAQGTPLVQDGRRPRVVRSYGGLLNRSVNEGADNQNQTA